MKYLITEYTVITCLMLALFGLTTQSALAQITEDKDMDQTQQEVEISGTVIDQSTQEPVANAKVYLSKKDTMRSNMERDQTIKKDKTIEGNRPMMAEGDSATTDMDGNFSFKTINPGTHTLTVEASGYEKWSKEVMLSSQAQKPKQLTIELRPRR